MTKHKKPKVEHVLETIRKCIEEDRYTMTKHAYIRHDERMISVPDIVHVLKTGYEEKKKTCYNEKHNAWNYAI